MWIKQIINCSDSDNFSHRQVLVVIEMSNWKTGFNFQYTEPERPILFKHYCIIFEVMRLEKKSQVKYFLESCQASISERLNLHFCPFMLVNI